HLGHDAEELHRSVKAPPSKMAQRRRRPLDGLLLCMWILCFAGCGNSSEGGTSAAGASAAGASPGGGSNGGDCAVVTVDPKYQGNYCNNAADHCYSRANHTAIIAASGQCATGDCLAQAIDLGSGTEKPDDYACFATCIPKKLMEMTGG